MKQFETFVEAVGAFFDVADWLTDNEGPAMTALMKAAETLDKKVSSTMLAEYGKVFRYLHGLRPDANKVPVDEFEDFLTTL